MPVEQWHLTLAFFGDVRESKVPELASRLARAVGRHHALDAQLAGAGTFGSAQQARLLWVGVDTDLPAMRRLADSVAAAGARATGQRRASRPFQPHLTLARARVPTDLTGCLRQLSSYAGPRWPLDRIVLVRSQLGAGEEGRPRHDALDGWSLPAR